MCELQPDTEASPWWQRLQEMEAADESLRKKSSQMKVSIFHQRS